MVTRHKSVVDCGEVLSVYTWRFERLGSGSNKFRNQMIASGANGLTDKKAFWVTFVKWCRIQPIHGSAEHDVDTARPFVSTFVLLHRFMRGLQTLIHDHE